MAFPSIELLSPKTQDWSITHSEETAAKGDYDAAFKLTTANTVALTSGRLCGMSINVEPLTAVSAYKAVGAEVCTYIDSAAVVPNVVGFFVETQGGTGITGDWYGLYVYSAPGANPTGTAHCIRVESNPSTITWQDSFINFVGDPNFTFYHSGQGTAGASTTDKTGTAAGWINVNMGGATRYIQLYS